MTVLAKWTKARWRRAYWSKRGNTRRTYRWRTGPTAAFPLRGRHARGCRRWVVVRWRAATELSVGRVRAEGVLAVILPQDRDPRFVTIRRGGTLTDADHRLLALWAAPCAEHVLHLFEAAKPADPRPRRAIEQARARARGEVTISQARTAAGHANAAARDLRGAARHAAYAAGQAAAVAHVAAHE